MIKSLFLKPLIINLQLYIITDEKQIEKFINLLHNYSVKTI